MSTDGVGVDDLQENTRVGATLALPIDRQNSVKLFASTGVATCTGGEAADTRHLLEPPDVSSPRGHISAACNLKIV